MGAQFVADGDEISATRAASFVAWLGGTNKVASITPASATRQVPHNAARSKYHRPTSSSTCSGRHLVGERTKESSGGRFRARGTKKRIGPYVESFSAGSRWPLAAGREVLGWLRSSAVLLPRGRQANLSVAFVTGPRG